MYKARGNRHQVTISGKTFWVDSNQEEALIRWLEANGFHDRWRRSSIGIQVGSYRYTPDIEVSVLTENGMTTRAIVESKPTQGHLSENQLLRMRKTTKFYATDMLLLYTHDFKKWQRINVKTGEILSEQTPTPGIKRIDELYKPWTRKGSKVWGHEYRQRLELGKRSALLFAAFLEKSMQALVGTLFPTKRNRKRAYKKRRKS